MRVLLTSHGSTGDIYPLIGLGRALREAGHHVRYATAPLYQGEIEQAGLEFVSLPPHWGPEIFADFMRELNRCKHPLLQLVHIYCGGLPFMGEVIRRMDEALRDTDLLVSSYFFPHYRAVAERVGVPFACFAFCHNLVPTEIHPPEKFPQLRWLPGPLRRRYCRAMWRLSSQVVDVTINSICRALFREAGLPPMRGFILNPAELELVGVGRAVGEHWQAEEQFKFAGYLRWQAPENARIEEELQEFCAGAEVPVLTFGSVTFDDVHTVMSRFLKHWPEGKKIIVQSGWAGLAVEVARPHIKVIGSVSHDQLFRHASCVVHHGGAGTTASVLFAGKPQIIIPHIADQWFWAAEIKRLRVGTKLNKKTWPEKLPAKVLKMEAKKKLRRRAQALAAKLRAEDGPGPAVKILEGFVAQKSRRPAQSASVPLLPLAEAAGH
ncbi:MAG TPA: nucleotide disphospho-sugar-binding domain-containing protein [Opitutales bacterium]|nr:nucleotide disphospho-sugar-binding domain-containing protein [Opitutales bacterium]